ncbi:MAG TPA: YfiR/HmsC family protein [Polyangiaceae bacterium]
MAVGVGVWMRDGAAQSVAVPMRLQAELLAKVAPYDRGFAGRARGRVLVLIVTKKGDAESERVAEQIRAELSVLPTIGGLPHSEEIVAYTSPQGIAELCRSRLPAIVYVSVGLLEPMEAIASALSGLSVLSVAASAAYVPRRAVLGFDVESGKPKLVVHLGQAKLQQIAFKPELLTLARVIQ